MKRGRIIYLLAVVLLASLAWRATATAQVAAPAPVRMPPASVAVCHLADVFTNCKRTKAEKTILEQRQAALANEEKQRRKALEALSAALEALKVGSPEYERKLAEAERVAVELQVWGKTQENVLRRRYDRVMADIYDTILSAIERIALQRGCQLVLYRDDVSLASGNTELLLAKIAQRKVLYHDPRLDVTADVLREVDRVFQQGR